MPVTGLRSIVTAEIPLVAYTLLIFLRNIVSGFDAVPREVLEAADGMGYTSRPPAAGRSSCRWPSR